MLSSDELIDSKDCVVSGAFNHCGIGFTQLGPSGLMEITEFDTRDGIYDCAWSEVCSVSFDTLILPVAGTRQSMAIFVFFLTLAAIVDALICSPYLKSMLLCYN